jgi:nicotinamidase-related amidase
LTPFSGFAGGKREVAFLPCLPHGTAGLATSKGGRLRPFISTLDAAGRRAIPVAAGHGKAFRRNAQPHIYVCSWGLGGLPSTSKMEVSAQAEISIFACVY